MNWKTEIKTDRDNQYEVCAPGKVGRDFETDNAITIEAKHHYNGSGPNAFGGAKQWPHVKLDVGFQEGQEGLRDEFVTQLRRLCEKFFQA
jgi:hypothetical protein